MLARPEAPRHQGAVYSIRRRGAAKAPPSNDSAKRVPDPEIRNTIALPLAQPARLTISCTMGARSGDFCAPPASPGNGHEGGAHETEADVRVRPPRLFLTVENVGALSAA